MSKATPELEKKAINGDLNDASINTLANKIVHDSDPDNKEASSSAESLSLP